MAEAKKTRSHEPTDDEKAESVGRTVKLATNSLDGKEISDEELDNLCDTTLSEVEPLPPKRASNGQRK